MKIPPRQWAYALGLFVSLAVLFGFHADAQPEVVAAPGAVDPLDRVGSDSAVLIHGRAAVLWAHPLVTDLRKQYAKPLEKVFAELQKNIGMTPDQLETVTFSYPKMPAGPGDESLFIVQVVTKAPYDKTKLLVAQRAPKAEAAQPFAGSSRETLLLINNLLLTASAAMVLLGTAALVAVVTHA